MQKENRNYPRKLHFDFALYKMPLQSDVRNEAQLWQKNYPVGLGCLICIGCFVWRSQGSQIAPLQFWDFGGAIFFSIFFQINPWQLMENWFLFYMYHWRLSKLMLVWFSIFSEFLLHYWQHFWIYLIILSINTCQEITRKSFFSSIFGFIFNFIFSRS